MTRANPLPDCDRPSHPESNTLGPLRAPGPPRLPPVQIEHSDYEGITAAVVVLDAPGMQVFGFGDAPAPVASELLACAHHKMIRGRPIGADALEL